MTEMLMGILVVAILTIPAIYFEPPPAHFFPLVVADYSEFLPYVADH